jgi:prephenate dehydrogenase
MSKVKFDSVLIIGVGLIGSSLARAIREYDLAKKNLWIGYK